MQYAANQQYYQYPFSQNPYAQQQASAYQYGQHYYQQPQPASQNQYPQAQQQPAMAQYAAAPASIPFPTPNHYPSHLSPPQTQHAQVHTSQLHHSQSQSSRPPPRAQTPHPARRPSGITKPLKSALKKPERANTTAVSNPHAHANAGSANGSGALLARARTHSGARENLQRLSSISRSRTNSMTRNNPSHIFLSLSGSNEMRVSNIAYRSTMDELKEKIPAMWPGGATSDSTETEWHVRFAGSPWSATGQDGVLAQRILIRVFWVLSNQGYVYLTSISTGNSFKPTQLVFVHAQSDPDAVFFTMTVNSRGTQVRFVDLPRGLAEQICMPLRYQFPRFVAEDKPTSDGGFTISLSEALSSGAVNKDLFLAGILKSLNDLAFKLDASVPLARTGLLGLGSRREVWVFKGSPSWWPTSARDH